MLLADTSMWVDHLRKSEGWFTSLLRTGNVYGHPLVTGEVLMGGLRDRGLSRSRLELLPQLTLAQQDDVLAFVEQHSLFSRGVGYIDINLLFSCYEAGCSLLTRDKALGALADSFGLRLIEP